jgi:hypothetical protein
MLTQRMRLNSTSPQLPHVRRQRQSKPNITLRKSLLRLRLLLPSQNKVLSFPPSTEPQHP